MNLLACMCAIDKATLPSLMDYWVKDVEVAGVHELLGNALVMKDEKRTTDLRGEPLPSPASSTAGLAGGPETAGQGTDEGGKVTPAETKAASAGGPGAEVAHA